MKYYGKFVIHSLWAGGGGIVNGKNQTLNSFSFTVLLLCANMHVYSLPNIYDCILVTYYKVYPNILVKCLPCHLLCYYGRETNIQN